MVVQVDPRPFAGKKPSVALLTTMSCGRRLLQASLSIYFEIVTVVRYPIDMNTFLILLARK